MRKLAVVLLLATALVLALAGRAGAAPGDIIADVSLPENVGFGTAPGVSVGFDGTYLYYTIGFGGATNMVLHRTDVPPPCGNPCTPSVATGHVDFPIVGAPPNGFTTISYDASRDVFWAASGDGLSIWQITNPTTTGTATATLQWAIDPVNDRPGNCDNADLAPPAGFCPPLIDGLAYDGVDDTIWYSPDGSERVYHYDTDADTFVTADLLGYFDVNDPPNDMADECDFNYSSGVAAGTNVLYLGADGCRFYFKYDKLGTELDHFAYDFPRAEDFECDDVSYNVDVIWARDAYDGHLRAFEQPVGTCLFGGSVAPPVAKGRMTGGARLLAMTPAGAEPQIAVTIHCDVTVDPNRMQVNWIDLATGKSHRFHMTTMTSATCTDDPTITPNPPGANFDTHDGKATGRYDGVAGATADWTLQDAGEPGTGVDRGRITIEDATGATVLDAPLGPTLDGDWQAHNTK